MLTIALIVVHVIVSLGIILLVLLHSGRGGGLSDMLGGVQSAAAGSTVVERNLDRATITLVLIWLFTTMSLAIRMQ